MSKIEEEISNTNEINKNKKYSKVFSNEEIEKKVKKDITLSKVVKVGNEDIQIGYQDNEYKVVFDGMIFVIDLIHRSEKNPLNVDSEELMSLLLFNDLDISICDIETVTQELKASLAERFDIKMNETAISMEVGLVK